jgi:hypothetical protein
LHLAKTNWHNTGWSQLQIKLNHPVPLMHAAMIFAGQINQIIPVSHALPQA